MLAAALPFEASSPVLSVAGHNLRSVHAVALVAVIVAASDLLRRSQPQTTDAPSGKPSTFALMCGAFLWMLFLSFLFADGFHLQAGMSFRRVATGVIVALLARHLLKERQSRHLVLVGFLAGASVAAVLGFGQLAGSADRLDSLFWGEPTQFGAIERLTMPFGHANTAGFHFAIAVVIGTTLLSQTPLLVDHQRRVRTALVAIATVVCAIALALTLSRSAMLAAVFVLGWIVLTPTRPVRRAGRIPPLAIGGLLITLVLVSSTWRLRIEDPSAAHWYGVSIEAPQTADSGETISVVITNESNERWSGSPVEVLEVTDASLGTDSAPLDRISIPALGPGASADIAVPIADKASGTLWIDIVRPGEGRFLRLTGQQAATVSLGDSEEPLAPPPGNVGPLPRSELWSAATTLARQRPLIGVGVGNFRLHYQDVVDRAGPATAHAHSIVFEPLASWGVPASLLFWGLLVTSMVTGRRRRADATVATATFGLVVMGIVGISDWPVASAAGGLALWLLIGMICHADHHDDENPRPISGQAAL